MIRRLRGAVCLLAGLAACGCAAHRPLRSSVAAIRRSADAAVGVAILAPDGSRIRCGDRPLPMLSVFKFPVALAVLERAAASGTPLDTLLTVPSSLLDPDTWSPMRDSLPPGGGAVSLEALLRYAVVRSDNIACDVLLDYAGGPAAVDRRMRSAGIRGMRIVVSERTMHRDPEFQRLNTARPSSVCRLFDRFLAGELLPPVHGELLRRMLLDASTGAAKLRAGLPPGTPLGHKTGSSDRTADGVRIADNDAGFVLLPDGRRYCVAVFVTDSRASDSVNAAIAAAVSRAAYEWFAATR